MSVFSRSKAARWRCGDRTWRRRRVARGLGAALARRGLHPGVLDDRGQVDVVDVVGPVDDARVEGEALRGRRRRARSSMASRLSTR